MSAESRGTTSPDSAAPAKARAAARLRAIAMMIAAVFSFTLLDTIAKLLARDYPIPEIVWGRYVFSLLPVMAAMPAIGGIARVVRTQRLFFQILRGVLLMIATASMFAAVRTLPLADVYAITFVSPLLVAAFSVVLLGESVDRRRWAAIFCGFLGVLVVVRPGFGAMDWTVVFPLSMAFFYALYQVATRALQRSKESQPTTLFYTALVGSALTSMALPFAWITPTPLVWLAMAAMGLIAAGGQFLLIRAFTIAPASLLSGFVYTQLVSAVVLGWLLFGDLPSVWVLAGSAIIIGSGLVLLRSRRD